MTEQENKQMVTISNNLKELLQKKMDAMPKNFNETRFLQNCLTVLSDTSDIAKYEPRSVARTMLKGAFLGLDFFNKECYAIPYGKELQFQTDYKGEIKICKRYSTKPISDVYAKVVREGDTFEAVIRGGKQIINFSPLNFNDGDVIGVFAVVYFQDGSMLYETMSKKEVDHIRTTFSKMPEGKAWKNSPEEMMKKTILRRICKMIDLDFDNVDQRDAFTEGSHIDPKKVTDTIDVTSQVSDPFKEDKPSEDKPNEEQPKPELTEDEKIKESPEFEAMKKIYPEEEDWQIIVRVKESNAKTDS